MKHQRFTVIDELFLQQNDRTIECSDISSDALVDIVDQAHPIIDHQFTHLRLRLLAVDTVSPAIHLARIGNNLDQISTAPRQLQFFQYSSDYAVLHEEYIPYMMKLPREIYDPTLHLVKRPNDVALNGLWIAIRQKRLAVPSYI